MPPRNLLRADQPLSDILDRLDGNRFAFDYETYGLEYMSSEFWVRSVSFVNDDVSVAVELSDESGNYYPFAGSVFNFLSRQRGLIAHNAKFEAGVTYAMTDVLQVPEFCTLAMSKYLANEGWDGQSWGLKDLAVDLLGQQYKGYDDKLPKSKEMAKADWDTLGYYNQIDSHVTWHLFKIMETSINDNKDTWGSHFWDFLEQDIHTWITQHTRTYIQGLMVDVQYTKEFIKQIEQEIEDRKHEIFSHEDIKPHVDYYNQKVIEAQENNLNSKNKFNKDGSLSKNWEKANTKLEIVKRYNHFNLDSPKQLGWLLYNKLDSEVIYTTDTGAPSTSKKALRENTKYGKLILDYRDTVSYYKFLRSVISNTTEDGLIRINTKTPGTLTGRASSGIIEENE